MRPIREAKLLISTRAFRVRICGTEDAGSDHPSKNSLWRGESEAIQAELVRMQTLLGVYSLARSTGTCSTQISSQDKCRRAWNTPYGSQGLFASQGGESDGNNGRNLACFQKQSPCHLRAIRNKPSQTLPKHLPLIPPQALVIVVGTGSRDVGRWDETREVL